MRARVQVIGRTSTGVPASWTVLGLNGLPHPQASRYLTYLGDLGRSPNTIKMYATGLAHYLTFLANRDCGLDDASNELFASFIHWLRAPGPDVYAFDDSVARVERSTVNAYLSAVSSFYGYLGSRDSGPGVLGYQRLLRTATERRRPTSTIVDNVGAARRHMRHVQLGPRVKERVHAVRILSMDEIKTIVSACATLQERLFFLLLATTGLRLGQLLGLRHEDLTIPDRSLRIVPRTDNENLARAKTPKSADLPVTRAVLRAYISYMHEEYGLLDSDYVFACLRKRRYGEPRRPSWAYSVVERLQKTTGITGWTPHTFRHSFVTHALEAGVPMDVVSQLALHASVRTTIDTYSHVSVDILRNHLIHSGFWDEE